MNNIVFNSASNLSKLILNREITVVEVMKAFLQHIRQYNPTINAISDMHSEDDLMAEAKQKDELLQQGKILGVLHGMPITVKDTYNVKGLLTTNGNPQLKKNIAKDDAYLVQQLTRAGAIIVGKSNLPLYSLDWQATNAWFGQTNNPYNLEHTVGGSSGGSAAALAAGFSPLELGSDAGGSIRVPAHFCGVCGIRPTESRLSIRGNMQTPGRLRIGRYITTNGPLARNVDDLIMAMKVLCSNEQRYSENPPVAFEQHALEPHRKIRIAYVDQLDNAELDHEYREVYDAFINQLKGAELSLRHDRPQYDADEVINLWGKLIGFDFGAGMPRFMPFKKLFIWLFVMSRYRDPYWAKGMSQGTILTPKGYATTLEKKDDLSDTFTRFFQDYDVWLTPASAAAAFKHQKVGKPFVINGKKVPYTRAFTPYNFPSVVPGHPIAVIPIGKTKSGLPVGIQIHGQKWHDYKVLQVAKVLEGFTEGFTVPEMFGKTEV